MQVYKFHHDPPVKAGCCNYRTSTTFWMADTREAAEEAIADHTPDGREDHGNCPHCFARLLAEEDYEVTRQND